MTADVLITGANGQLGWELQRRATASSRTARAFTRTDLNITDADSVARTIEAASPKVVVNTAAYTAVDKAETEPAAAFAVNRDGPANLATTCAELNIPLIHISTDYVFDGTKPDAYSEEDAVAPLGVYGESKLAGENAIRASDAEHVILRTAWVYGVHGHNFVKTMLRLGEKQDALRIVGDQHGCPSFAGDLADTILKISDRMRSGDVPANGHGTFHCTGEGSTTWCDFARTIFELAGPTTGRVPTVDGITTAEYPTPARRPANSVLDCGKLTRTYGITLRPWQEALAEMLQFTLSEDTGAAKEMR
ncbi:MAG: dTDP-4-dehydrorhamnose reductase [Alphaproteobacteria bacterium]|nr:dTDP-4-dehydrorhamnose reductase [Alphaproteobacteria bacterium]